MSELRPNAYGELCDSGRVADCYLALPLAAQDDTRPARVLVGAPRGLLHPAVPPACRQPALRAGHRPPQPAARRAGHPRRPSRRAARLAPDTSGSLTAELARVAAAVVGCWQRGDLLGLDLPLAPGEDPRVLTRPAMTLARAALRARLDRQVTRARCRWLHPSNGRRIDEPFL